MSAPERIFLGWDRPTLAAAADCLLRRYGAQLGDLTVVLPGRRAGRRLLELLEQCAPADWTPPQISTLGQFSDTLTTWPLPRAGDPLRMLAWIAALQQAPSASLRCLLPHPPESKELEAWWPVAEMLRALHSELAAEGWTFAQVAQKVDAVETPRWDALAWVQQEFASILKQSGHGDPHLMSLAALQSGKVLPLDGPMVLLGMPQANRLQRLLLESIEEDWTVLIAAPEDLADAFDAFGFVCPAAWGERPLTIPESRIHVCAERGHQAQMVRAQLDQHRGACAAEDVTLGVLDASSLPLLERELREEGFGIHTPTGFPGERTQVARLLEAMSAWLVRPGSTELGALLRHPDLENLLSEHVPGGADPVALDFYQAEHLAIQAGPDWLQHDPERKSSKGHHAVLRQQSAVLWKMSESLRGKARTASAWAPLLRDWLQEVYGEQELDRSREGDRRLAHALETCLEILQQWTTLPSDGPSAFPLRGADALLLLLRDLQNSEVPPPPDTSPSVDAVEWLELALDDAPVLLITDFQEGCAPKSLSGSALLDQDSRRRLGMPGDEEHWARDRYLIEWILHARSESEWPHFFLCRLGPDGDPLQPSRFLFLAEDAQVVARARKLFADKPPSPEARQQGLPSPLVWPGPRSGLEYETEVFSCSRLNRYLASPYSYYLESVLKLEACDDRARELDPLMFGGLLHAVLERFGNEAGMKELEDEESIREAVFALLQEEGARRFGRPARPLVELQLLQAEFRLRLFARKQAELRAKGWQIHTVEWSPAEGRIPLEFDSESFSLRGFIDRVDRREVDGRTEWHIIDYKSGDKPKKIGDCWKPNSKRWDDVQLALYPYLTRSLTGGRGAAIEGSPVRASYWNLGAHDSNHGLNDLYLNDEMREQLELQVAAAVRGIRAGVFFDPEQPRRHRSPLAMRCMGDGLLAGADDENGEVEES